MMSGSYMNGRRAAFLREQHANEARRERETQQRVTATTVAVVETIREVSEPFSVVARLSYDPATDRLERVA